MPTLRCTKKDKPTKTDVKAWGIAGRPVFRTKSPAMSVSSSDSLGLRYVESKSPTKAQHAYVLPFDADLKLRRGSSDATTIGDNGVMLFVVAEAPSLIWTHSAIEWLTGDKIVTLATDGDGVSQAAAHKGVLHVLVRDTGGAYAPATSLLALSTSGSKRQTSWWSDPPNALAVRDAAVHAVWLDNTPPTGDSPAVVEVGGQLRALAPWQTLTRGDDARCKDATGYRAIVRRVWLDHSVNGKSGLPARRVDMLVRWTASRVCLDAVTIGSRASWNSGGSVVLVARFAPKAAATQVVTVGQTSEQFELTCTLSK